MMPPASSPRSNKLERGSPAVTTPGRDGAIVVKKPQGLTSHDVVERIRHAFATRRVGHTGTLDPMAEGVLIILIGAATRFQREFQGHHKCYEALIQFGTQTDTGDAWGRPIRTMPVPPLQREQVEAVLSSFVGTSRQVPPAFSAVKVEGRPLYWWTRRGITKSAPARTVTITSLDLLELGPSTIRVRLICSAGTYMRALAEACAERLGTVGHVSQLMRLAVGPWDLSQAYELAWIEQIAPEARWDLLQRVDATTWQRSSSAAGH